MDTKKTLLLIGFLGLYLPVVLACTCYRTYFCEYIEEETTVVAFQARVIAHKDYGPQQLAIYLEIIKRYKDEVGMTDTIKLYGSQTEADCSVNVHNNYPVGDTLIVAIGTSTYNERIMNPDSLTENYWESYPFLCDFKRLLVKDGRVSGTIANQIFEYPLTLFDNQLDGCNFSVEQLEDSRCAANHYIVFPNPSSTGNVTIQSVYVWNPLQKIRMFGYDGRLIRELKAADTSEYLYQRVEIKGLQDGLYIIEILCNDQRYYKKVIINK